MSQAILYKYLGRGEKEESSVLVIQCPNEGKVGGGPFRNQAGLYLEALGKLLFDPQGSPLNPQDFSANHRFIQTQQPEGKPFGFGAEKGNKVPTPRGAQPGCGESRSLLGLDLCASGEHFCVRARLGHSWWDLRVSCVTKCAQPGRWMLEQAACASHGVPTPREI